MQVRHLWSRGEWLSLGRRWLGVEGGMTGVQTQCLPSPGPTSPAPAPAPCHSAPASAVSNLSNNCEILVKLMTPCVRGNLISYIPTKMLLLKMIFQIIPYHGGQGELEMKCVYFFPVIVIFNFVISGRLRPILKPIPRNIIRTFMRSRLKIILVSDRGWRKECCRF